MTKLYGDQFPEDKVKERWPRKQAQPLPSADVGGESKNQDEHEHEGQDEGHSQETTPLPCFGIWAFRNLPWRRLVHILQAEFKLPDHIVDHGTNELDKKKADDIRYRQNTVARLIFLQDPLLLFLFFGQIAKTKTFLDSFAKLRKLLLDKGGVEEPRPGQSQQQPVIDLDEKSFFWSQVYPEALRNCAARHKLKQEAGLVFALKEPAHEFKAEDLTKAIQSLSSQQSRTAPPRKAAEASSARGAFSGLVGSSKSSGHKKRAVLTPKGQQDSNSPACSRISEDPDDFWSPAFVDSDEHGHNDDDDEHYRRRNPDSGGISPDIESGRGIDVDSASRSPLSGFEDSGYGHAAPPSSPSRSRSRLSSPQIDGFTFDYDNLQSGDRQEQESRQRSQRETASQAQETPGGDEGAARMGAMLDLTPTALAFSQADLDRITGNEYLNDHCIDTFIDVFLQPYALTRASPSPPSDPIQFWNTSKLSARSSDRSKPEQPTQPTITLVSREGGSFVFSVSRDNLAESATGTADSDECVSIHDKAGWVLGIFHNEMHWSLYIARLNDPGESLGEDSEITTTVETPKLIEAAILIGDSMSNPRKWHEPIIAPLAKRVANILATETKATRIIINTHEACNIVQQPEENVTDCGVIACNLAQEFVQDPASFWSAHMPPEQQPPAPPAPPAP